MRLRRVMPLLPVLVWLIVVLCVLGYNSMRICISISAILLAVTLGFRLVAQGIYYLVCAQREDHHP